MMVTERWLAAMSALDLPEQPEVLLAAPGPAAGVVEALARARPAARVVALDCCAWAAGGPEPLGLGEARFHAAVFDHAIDDIVLAAVARHEGIASDGDDVGPYAANARAVRAYWRSGDLDRVVAGAFAEMVGACARALRPGAEMVFHHHVVGPHLTGQPLDLYTDYLLHARRWIDGAPLGLREVALDGLDRQWWMRLVREG